MCYVQIYMCYVQILDAWFYPLYISAHFSPRSTHHVVRTPPHLSLGWSLRLWLFRSHILVVSLRHSMFNEHWRWWEQDVNNQYFRIWAIGIETKYFQRARLTCMVQQTRLPWSLFRLSRIRKPSNCCGSCSIYGFGLVQVTGPVKYL
jgi:hypothetical protein